MLYLKQLKAKIIVLQETNIAKAVNKRVGAKWPRVVFQSNFQWKSRGVAIIISNTTIFCL